MFKKIAAFGMAMVASVFMAQASMAAQATTYKEGVHYQVRTDKLTAHKEIREFFSFWCSHCFSLQSTFDAVHDAYPNAAFERNPVAMLGGPMGPESQRALVVATNLGLQDVFVKELFNQMHNEGNIPMTHAQLVEFMGTIGIAKDKFEREFNSFPVLGKVAQLDKWGDDINIEAVPEILINGKYLVTMESVNSDKELIDLIGYLLKLDNLPDANSK